MTTMTRTKVLKVSDPVLLTFHVDYNPGGQTDYQPQPEQTTYPPTTATSKSQFVADEEEEYNPGQAQQNDYGYKPNYGAAAEEDTYKTAYETYQETPKQPEPSSKVRFDEDDMGTGTYEYKPHVA